MPRGLTPVDEPLLRAWETPTSEQTLDEFLGEVERLLAILVPAGYVTVNEEAETWSFTQEGVRRWEELQTDS